MRRQSARFVFAGTVARLFRDEGLDESVIQDFRISACHSGSSSGPNFGDLISGFQALR